MKNTNHQECTSTETPHNNRQPEPSAEIHKGESRKRRVYDPEFKARVAIAAIRGEGKLAEISEYYNVHYSQISEWKRQLISRAALAFQQNMKLPR